MSVEAHVRAQMSSSICVRALKCHDKQHERDANFDRRHNFFRRRKWRQHDDGCCEFCKWSYSGPDARYNATTISMSATTMPSAISTVGTSYESGGGGGGGVTTVITSSSNAAQRREQLAMFTKHPPTLIRHVVVSSPAQSSSSALVVVVHTRFSDPL